jgi:hypothetical protein
VLFLCNVVHNRTSKTLNGYVAQFFSDDVGNAMMPKRPARRLRYDRLGMVRTAPDRAIRLHRTHPRTLRTHLVTVQAYIDFYPLGHKRDFQRAYRAGLRDAIN